MDCIFCKVVSGKLPSTKHYEDNDVIVISDIHPQAAIHLLVIPKMHVTDIMGTDERLLGKLFGVAKKMIREKGIGAHRIVINGRGAQFVEHLHVHVMGGITKERTL